MPRFSQSEQRRLIREAMRYAQKSQGGRLFRSLGKKFGAFGEVIGVIADILTGGKQPSRRDITDAIDLLQRSGFRVTPGVPGGPDQPPVQAPPVGGTGIPARLKMSFASYSRSFMLV